MQPVDDTATLRRSALAQRGCR